MKAGDNKPLAHYYEYAVTVEELKTLPQDQLAAVAVLQYAVRETNTLRKIYLCQDHKPTGVRALDSGINCHRFTVLRLWSAKLFEAIEFLQAGIRKDFRNDEKLRVTAQVGLKAFETLCDGEGYETARDIRHEATNHYSINAAKKNLKHIPSAMDATMYMTNAVGNEFYPFGEAVMFHARLNRRWANCGKEERDKRFHSWLNWNLGANEWLSKTHSIFVNEFVFKNLGRNGVRKKAYWVPPTYAGDRTERLTPIFFQEFFQEMDKCID